MATAAATADAPKKGHKKLVVIIAAAVLLLAVLGGGAFLLLGKKKAPDGEDGESGAESAAPAKVAVRRDPKVPPTFVPLDAFVVNLADRESDRYAQVGITLEVDDPQLGDQIKLYMPAIRNNILMALADKTAAQLADREGKTRLADRVRRETSRALGYEVEEPEEEAAQDPAAADAAPKKKRRKKREEVLPITAVHFSNFIIQ